jgi:hypothetical protein
MGFMAILSLRQCDPNADALLARQFVSASRRRDILYSEPATIEDHDVVG